MGSVNSPLNLTNQNNSSFLDGTILVEMNKGGHGMGRGCFPFVTDSKLSLKIFLRFKPNLKSY